MGKIVDFTYSEGFEMLFVFLTGAFGYGMLEMLWRGETHYTMLITGGLCFFIIYFLNLRYMEDGLFFKCCLGMLVITALEFLVGILVNDLMRMQVWDYSMLPFNFMGQVCLLYSVFWFILGIPLAYLVPLIHRFLVW